MKPILLPATLLLLFLLPAARSDQFVTGQAADVVLGQVDFNSNLLGNTPSNLSNPGGVAFDPSTGKLFVSDSLNSRIFRFASAASAVTGSSAEAAFGQVDLFSNDTNQGGPTATLQTLNIPGEIAFDSSGRLWVADSLNNRVLGYLIASLTANNVSADYVFGQPNFTATSPPGPSDPATASAMSGPTSVWVDGDDNLWVADSGHHRILRFDDVSSKANGAPANLVLGQADFAAKTSGTTNTTLSSPGGICVDEAGRLWVADSSNNRVLRFDNAANLSNGAPATRVLGQSDFVSSGIQTSATRMNLPAAVFADAEGTLWVADAGNRRVLGFRNASSKGNGDPANFVLGQTNFTNITVAASSTGMANAGQISAGVNGTIWVVDKGNSRVLRYSKIKTPSLTIATRPFTTDRATARVRGGTAGTVSVVTHRVGARGPFRKAKGTARWSFVAKLKTGRNLITVFAEGPGGKSVPKRIAITRR
jgi:sugar lactone lactonase YvrE